MFGIQTEGSSIKEMEEDKCISCRTAMPNGSLSTLLWESLSAFPKQTGAKAWLERMKEALEVHYIIHMPRS